MTGKEVNAASIIRSDWFKAAAEAFENVDVMILPSAQVWPFDVATEYPTEIAGRTMGTYHRWMEVMIAPSLIGLPVVNIPMGFGGPNNLPMGLQLIGKRGSDAMAASRGTSLAWGDPLA